MYLDKDQLEFLEYLSRSGDITRENILTSQLDIVRFLEKQELINANREIIHTRFNGENNTYTNTYGDIISISISEQGKAYLAETVHENDFAKSIEKIAKSAEIQSDIALKKSKKADIKGWIAVIISVLALFVEFMAYHKEIFSFLAKIIN